MKTLSNNKGISLVILIIAMTLIAVLGASFVSLVATKHKGFLNQIDSYRALNISNAGVEYAIRSISDEASTTSGNFFINPNGTINKSFGGGNFTANYNYASDLISVSGSYGGSTKQIRLTNFRRYIDPLTLLYDPAYGGSSSRKPSTFDWSSMTYVYIPLLNNSGMNITITRLDIVIPLSGRSLQYIEFYDTAYRTVYDFNWDWRFSICGSATCRNWNGILLSSGVPGVSFPFNMGNYSIITDTRHWCVLEFDRNTFSSPTQYQIIFYYTLAGVPRTSTIKFDL